MARCRKAGVPEGVGFATMIELAREMIGSALEAGVPARWVTADEAYGNDSKFRRFLEERGIGYVVAVNARQMAWVEFQNKRVSEFFASCPAKAWKRLSCGEGSKGPRTYDWAVLVTTGAALGGPLSGVLARRSVSHPEEIAYYRWSSPRRVLLADLVNVAGSRWSIESGFAQAKQEVGLDNYEVRSWDGWHRHVTLALFAQALLKVIRIKATGAGPKKRMGDASHPPDCARSEAHPGRHRLGSVPASRKVQVALASPPSGHRKVLPLQDQEKVNEKQIKQPCTTEVLK